MTSRSFHIVTPDDPSPIEQEPSLAKEGLAGFLERSDPGSPADRIRRLQSEARALAREHIEQLAAALNEVSRLAGEIAGGGDLYPVGARELSRRLTEDAGKHALTLTAIVDRS